MPGCCDGVGCPRPHKINGLLFVNESRRDRIGIPIAIEDACLILDSFEIKILSFVPCFSLLESAAIFLAGVSPNVCGVIEDVLETF